VPGICSFVLDLVGIQTHGPCLSDGYEEESKRSILHRSIVQNTPCSIPRCRHSVEAVRTPVRDLAGVLRGA
jgi:hypothetical protein